MSKRKSGGGESKCGVGEVWWEKPCKKTSLPAKSDLFDWLEGGRKMTGIQGGGNFTQE